MRIELYPAVTIAWRGVPNDVGLGTAGMDHQAEALPLRVPQNSALLARVRRVQGTLGDAHLPSNDRAPKGALKPSRASGHDTVTTERESCVYLVPDCLCRELRDRSRNTGEFLASDGRAGEIRTRDLLNPIQAR